MTSETDAFSSLLICGDARETLAQLPDNSVDSVVTDPPYGLSKLPDAAEVLRHWLAGDDYEHGGGGFMGKSWDSFVPGPVLWKEVFRVLKPGGHLLSFGGTRTYDLMVMAIRLAGFEIRDSVHWTFGSGFPKSLDVSKAIDKAARGFPQGSADPASPNHGRYKTQRTEGKRGDSDTGRGYGGGPGAFMAAAGESTATAPATDAAKQWAGFGTALKPAHEPVVVARKPLAGTVAANVLEHGTGALNIDASRVGMSDADRQVINNMGGFGSAGWVNTTSPAYNTNNPDNPLVRTQAQAHTAGRWPANLVLTHAAECGEACAEGCPVAELDGQSGRLSLAGNKPDSLRQRGTEQTGNASQVPTYSGGPTVAYRDTGGASRFFTVTEWDPTADVAPFRYVAKPSKRERNAGLDGGNKHPTVKPVALCRWLVRLVTPPGGTVLDPFIGSGTTGIAAHDEGFCFIGIDQSDEYLQIAYARQRHAGASVQCVGFAPLEEHHELVP